MWVEYRRLVSMYVVVRVDASQPAHTCNGGGVHLLLRLPLLPLVAPCWCSIIDNYYCSLLVHVNYLPIAIILVKRKRNDDNNPFGCWVRLRSITMATMVMVKSSLTAGATDLCFLLGWPACAFHLQRLIMTPGYLSRSSQPPNDYMKLYRAY